MLVTVAACAGCTGMSVISFGDSTLTVGVEGIEGTVNPFYCSNETDSKIISQIFAGVQREGSNGKLVNYCGGITYVETDTGVKYTVNIKDDLVFSDGTPVTIDDIIFFYHFIADATYDGVYSDWHLNDIRGLDAYYYDDVGYADAIANIEYEVATDYTAANISLDDFVKYLAATNIEGEWQGELSAQSPYGNTWAQQIDKAGYSESLDDLGAAPDAAKLTELVATMQAQTNPKRYDPESWWRSKLYSDYIGKNYSDGIDVDSISGIKKINDYACTITYNSKNADAIAQINALIVSKAFYSAEYRKGNAAAVKDITATALGSGPYAVREVDIEEGSVSLIANAYSNDKPGYDMVEFIDLAAKGKNPVDCLRDGTVDMIEIAATQQAMDSLKADDIYTGISDSQKYTSLFFNTNTLGYAQRAEYMNYSDCSQELVNSIGAYYTALYLPINAVLFDGISANENFNSYPYGSSASPATTLPQTEPDQDGDSADDTQSPQSSAITQPVNPIDLYCSADCDEAALAAVDAFKKKVEAGGVKVNVYSVPAEQLISAVKSGEADVWLAETDDSISGDKYEQYHSNGSQNLTGVSDRGFDALLVKSHTSLNTKDRREYAPELFARAMQLSFELPLYQRKVITAYRTDVINIKSIPEAAETCGYRYAISSLTPAK